ncbi:ATP-binding protein [Aliikangiella sp. G2MR2-5]|uniref:ATP-binding protein n=1 Tax=Aliikangiella sp. G2MR2-5 TaxID=2788943 RepID=UPI0018AB7609|nr:ATP-binding protein [Aliikangiella sp. G2MR2-5]
MLKRWLRLARIIRGSLFILVIAIWGGGCLAAGEGSEQKQIPLSWYSEEVKRLARNEPKVAIEIAEKALRYVTTKENAREKAQLLNAASYAFYFLSEYSSSLQRALEAEALAKEYGFAGELARSLVLQGNLLQISGALEPALEKYKSATETYIKLQKLKELKQVYNNIANTYYVGDRFEAAIDYYNKSAADSSDPAVLAKSKLGIANVYSARSNTDKAIENYQLARTLYEKAQDSLGIMLSMRGIAEQFLVQKKFEQALGLIEEIETVSVNRSQLFKQASNLLIKARAQSGLDLHQKALDTVENAISLSEEVKQDFEKINALKLKSEILYRTGQFREAYDIRTLVRKLEKEQELQQHRSQLSIMQTLFDVESKNNQIKLLASKNKLKDLEIIQQRTFAWLIVGIVLLVCGLTVFYFYRKSQLELIDEHKAVAKKLLELDKLKDQVLTNTSHELRTPLNGIIGMSELLKEDLTLSPDQQESVDVIIESGQRLLSLVRDITDFSQLQAGKLSIEKQPISLFSAVDKAMKILESMASSKEIMLYNGIPQILPKVVADPKRLQQILLNLLGNAIKFSHQGIVSVRSVELEDSVLIKVVDEGIGIEVEQLDSIFRPFEQVDGSFSRENEGTGLGLPITQELLKLHGSSLMVTSSPGKGSCFSFSLEKS